MNKDSTYRRYVAIADTHPPRGDEQDRADLVKYRETGDCAHLQKIILHNMRWIIKMVQARCAVDDRVPPEDLVGDAILGFYDGLERFDLARSNKILTFCGFRINLALSNALFRHQSLYIPPKTQKNNPGRWSQVSFEDAEYDNRPLSECLADPSHSHALEGIDREDLDLIDSYTEDGIFWTAERLGVSLLDAYRHVQSVIEKIRKSKSYYYLKEDEM